jgi:hypothetical protein
MLSSAFVMPDKTESICFCVLKIFLKKIKNFLFVFFKLIFFDLKNKKNIILIHLLVKIILKNKQPQSDL